MTRLRRSSVSIGVVALLMMFSGLAAAGVGAGNPTDGADEAGTNLVIGYDEENGILVTGISPTDGEYDCTILEGEVLSIGYGDPMTDGKVPTQVVTLFEGDEGEVEFTANEDGVDPVAYSDETNPCVLTGAPIAGPNGQINHGKFVSTFAKLLEGGHKGCLMRILAHSDLGKGDMQVKPSDVDPEAPEEAIPAEGLVELVNQAATCQNNGKRDKAAKENPGQAKKAERTADGKSPGQSGNAPGRNKDE